MIVSQLSIMLSVKLLAAVTAWASIVVGSTLQGSCPSCDVDLKTLGKNLSKTAKVYCPGTSGFNNVTTRWSVLEEPKVNVVVVPGTENDVAETVRSAIHP